VAQNNNHFAGELPAVPNRKLKTLESLVGDWRIFGPDVEGTKRFAWMEGGFFLVHDFDQIHAGRQAKGVEYIGHDVETDELVARLMGTDGSRFDYIWERLGERYNAWFGGRGSARRMMSRFVTPDRIEGRWEWPPGDDGVAGYDYVMERQA
jgi:hypothetical protein